MFKKLLNWFDGGYDREFYQKHQDDIQKLNPMLFGVWHRFLGKFFLNMFGFPLQNSLCCFYFQAA